MKRIYEPAGPAVWFDRGEYANPQYSYDPDARAVRCQNDKGLLRRVETIDGRRLLPVVTLGDAAYAAAAIPADCVVIED